MPIKEEAAFLLKHKKGGFIGTKAKQAINKTGYLFIEWAHAKTEINKIEKEHLSLKEADWWELRYVNRETLLPITGE